jgi:hypothetical protein
MFLFILDVIFLDGVTASDGIPTTRGIISGNLKVGPLG